MDELETYVDFLFNGLEGYVYVPVKGEKWNPAFFHWPDERQQTLDWIKTNSKECDVYISPAVYSERRADKSAVKDVQVAWVEFDGQEQIEFRDLPAPDAIVQTSSSTHLHCYWQVRDTTPEGIEDTNKRLTYYLGADSSGWDVTQLLRPPSSKNFKPTYSEPLPVKLSLFRPTGNLNPSRLDAAPTVTVKRTEINEADLIPGRELLELLELPNHIRLLVKAENPVEPYRSSFLFKVANELAEEGLAHAQIVSLLQYVDNRIGKYTGREDALHRLSGIADLAIHKVSLSDEIQVYSLKDALEHTEDLEWIIPGWLHTQGLMIVTAAPGVGKTQFCLQLTIQVVQGLPFLGKELSTPTNKSSSTTTHSTLFLSLEMDLRSLKYILSHQAKEWGQIDQSKFHLVDQEASLLQYENLIHSLCPTILFIDSLSELLEDDDPSGEAKRVMKWIKKIRRRYNLAVILIHHNRKASVGNKKPKSLDDLVGSFHFARQTETALCLWENSPGSNEIELSAIKARFDKKGVFGNIYRNKNLWFSTDESDKESVPTTETHVGDGSVNFRFGGH